MNTKSRAYPVYLWMETITSLGSWLVFTVDLIYQVTIVGLNPLQLVIVGTTIEVTAFIFEVPTGVVADTISRKLSIIIGTIMIGAGFILEGAIPRFETILIAQVIAGIGYTFTSGATEAWIADEIGEGGERHGEVLGPSLAQPCQIGHANAPAQRARGSNDLGLRRRRTEGVPGGAEIFAEPPDRRDDLCGRGVFGSPLEGPLHHRLHGQPQPIGGIDHRAHGSKRDAVEPALEPWILSERGAWHQQAQRERQQGNSAGVGHTDHPPTVTTELGVSKSSWARGAAGSTIQRDPLTRNA